MKSQKIQSVIATSQSAQSVASTRHSDSVDVIVCSWEWRSLAMEICQIFPFLMTFSAISLQIKDFLRCPKRSLPTWEAKTKTKTPLRAQKLGLMFSTSATQRSEKVGRYQFEKRTVTNTNQKVWPSCNAQWFVISKLCGNYSILRDHEFANSRQPLEAEVM